MHGAAAGLYSAWAVTWWLPQAIAEYFDAGLLVGAATISVAYVVAVSSTFGAFAWGVARLTSRPAAVRLLGTAALWVTVELIRGRGLDDPWALLGYTQYRQLALIQLATLTGVYGVSFLVALGNAALAEFIAARRRGNGLSAPVLAAAAIVLAWGAGWQAMPTSTGADAAVRIAVVQPNVPPAHTWTRAWAERQLAAALELTRTIAPETTDLAVWPENALALYPETEPFVRTTLAALTARRGFDLIVGGPRHDGRDTFNSARLVRSDGRWAHYDKQRLVPFAEAPVGSLSATDEPSVSPRTFRAGRAPGLLHARIPLGVSICHELLFPDVVHGAVAAGATLLVNIANDGWLDGGFGVASRQHFAMGVFRAVEARRYLVRAATTGVSGIVDPAGRVLAVTDTDTATVVRRAVHPRSELTPYVRWGDWFGALCVLLAATLLVPARVRLRSLPRPLLDSA